MLPPILKTILSPTLSAVGNVAFNSLHALKMDRSIVRNHASSGFLLSGCFTQNSLSGFLAITCIISISQFEIIGKAHLNLLCVSKCLRTAISAPLLGSKGLNALNSVHDCEKLLESQPIRLITENPTTKIRVQAWKDLIIPFANITYPLSIYVACSYLKLSDKGGETIRMF